MPPHRPPTPYRAALCNGRGVSPAPVAALLLLLEAHPLTSWTSLERTAVRGLPSGLVSLTGNFRDLDHPFSLLTNEPELVATLTRAVQANRARFNVTPEKPDRLRAPARRRAHRLPP